MKPWSRGRTLGLGIGLIVLTNAVALVGVWWNRAAPPDSTLTLSERELGLPWHSLRNQENSGLALSLRWRVATHADDEFNTSFTYNSGSPAWLDAAKMEALGFTTGAIDSDAGRRRYLRQLPRAAVLVMELNGPAAQAALDKARTDAARHAAAAAVNADSKQFAERAKRAQGDLDREEHANSRLFVIDAGGDAEQLRQKYPDRTRYVLLRGIVRPGLNDRAGGKTQPGGHISRITNGTIHVPHALRAPLESLRATGEPGGGDRFGATLRVGRRLEPWIVDTQTRSKSAE